MAQRFEKWMALLLVVLLASILEAAKDRPGEEEEAFVVCPNASLGGAPRQPFGAPEEAWGQTAA